ncbi:MAG TPA: hypothetical protein VIY69_10390, partial [Candidatus Acidoferrales bacterium]
YDASTGKFKLDPQNWNPPVPPGFPMLGVDGSLNTHTDKISGNITGGDCTTFQATRNEAESAALPKQPPAPPRVGGNAATPTTQPAQNQSKPQN